MVGLKSGIGLQIIAKGTLAESRVYREFVGMAREGGQGMGKTNCGKPPLSNTII